MSYTREEHQQCSGIDPDRCPTVPGVGDSPERYVAEIEQARRAARRLRAWAAASAVVGLAGIVGAIAMYASSWSVALAASRLELQLRR